MQLLSVVAGGLYWLVAHLWQLEESVVSDSAVAVADFLVPSLAVGLPVCAVVDEGLGSDLLSALTAVAVLGLVSADLESFSLSPEGFAGTWQSPAHWIAAVV